VTAPQPPALRVEQALRLLPTVDALSPLRAFLISSSRARSSAEPHGTVGKRHVQPDDLRDLMPRALKQITEHLGSLYDAALAALEAEQKGDETGAVRALLRAGALEEAVRRHSEAYAWYDHALRIAAGLRDRRPEIEALRHLGHLDCVRGRLESGSRYFQRSLALAEDEMDHLGAALACQGLGKAAVAGSTWQGAEAWFGKGLRYAGAAPSELNASLLVGLADAARGRGQFELAADRLRQARLTFDKLGDEEGGALVLNGDGLLQVDQGDRDAGLARYRESLARLRRAGKNPRLEMSVRLNICRMFLDSDRLPDAEDEARRAEEIAIIHNFTFELAGLYSLMGRMRGMERDETGFVFFEKAIELCQGPDPFPRLEAEIFREYGLFRSALGEREEAIAYLERSREILEGLGDRATLAQIEGDLALLSASDAGSGEIQE
jgi:tetratricopeptide (TPR) repeat protein